MNEMAVIVSGRGKKSEDSIGVKPGGEPPVIVGGVSEPGKIIVKGSPQPHSPLKASPVLKGIVRGQSRRVSVRPNLDDVARSIHEIKTRHLRPVPLVAPARIHDSAADSPVVVKPAGWKAMAPNYPQKLGATPFVTRPESQKYPIREPKPMVMLEGVVHGPGSRENEPVPPPIPVEDITKRPIKTKVHDFTFGAHRTYKYTSG